MGDEDYRRGRAYTMVNKYVASAAHIAGKRIVSAEEMTNTYLVFRTPLEFLKVGSDMAAFSGITHSVWHGFNYSPLEAPFPGWVQYGTFHNERNTWWPYVKRLNDYRTRMSSVLQNVDLVAPIAILPPNGDLWSEMGAQNEPFPAHLNVQWTSILWEAIHKNGGGADYLSEGVIRDARVLGGRLHCRERSYGVLFLAGLKGIDGAVMDKIDRFVRDGGRVFCVGDYPCKSLGLKDFEQRDAAIRAKVAALVRDCPERFVKLEMPAGETGWLEWYTGVMERYGLPHDVTITSPDPFLLQNHYLGDDGTDWYLFANASFSKPQDTDLIFDSPFAQALLYDPDEGVRYALDTKGDILHLHLGPSETVLISLSDRVADAPKRDILPLPDPSAPALEAHWDVTLVNPQVEGSVRFSCTELPDLKDTHPSFMGTADYKTVVTLPSDAAQMPHFGVRPVRAPQAGRQRTGGQGDHADVQLYAQPSGQFRSQALHFPPQPRTRLSRPPRPRHPLLSAGFSVNSQYGNDMGSAPPEGGRRHA